MQAATPEGTWRLLSRWLSPEEGTLWRQSSYRFHALVAQRWRAGRVFLAGDAAHMQPPFLGQGMCQGVRDAANLAWKLSAVLRGEVTGEAVGAIPAMTWHDAMERYGSDKPDLRFGMELVDLGAVFAATEFRAFQAEAVKGFAVPGQGEASRSTVDGLVDRAKSLGAAGLVWMRVRDGGALESPVVKFLSDDEQVGLLAATGAAVGDLVLVVADEYRLTCSVLGALRCDLGGRPVSEGPFEYVWVVDFPLFDGVDDAGHPVAAHHPFTMPHPDDLDLLERDPAAVRSQAYDLVLNGWELGSGSVRVHRADIQSRIFAALGIDEEEAAARFGFLLGAFRFGAPPHAGFAVGIDRLAAIFAGEDSIREVIAFPKTQSGWDPMTDAPKALADGALADLGLRPMPSLD